MPHDTREDLQVTGRAEHLVSLARLRLRQGQSVAALVALRRGVLARASRERRVVRKALAGMPRLVEAEAYFEGVVVSHEAYEGVFARFAESCRGALPRRVEERAIVMHNLLVFFDAGWVYGVREVRRTLGEAIDAFSLSTDARSLCRSMMALRMFRRTVDGQLYWVNPTSPVRVERAAA